MSHRQVQYRVSAHIDDIIPGIVREEIVHDVDVAVGTGIMKRCETVLIAN